MLGGGGGETYVEFRTKVSRMLRRPTGSLLGGNGGRFRPHLYEVICETRRVTYDGYKNGYDTKA